MFAYNKNGKLIELNMEGLLMGGGEDGYLREPLRADMIRTFDTGATRDTDNGKLDYEGFLCPEVLERYAQFMHKNRVQSNGYLRDSDNWQKGIPRNEYMKSMWRHFHKVWKDHRRGEVVPQEELCALLFNAMGYLHETLKGTP